MVIPEMWGCNFSSGHSTGRGRRGKIEKRTDTIHQVKPQDISYFVPPGLEKIIGPPPPQFRIRRPAISYIDATPAPPPTKTTTAASIAVAAFLSPTFTIIISIGQRVVGSPPIHPPTHSSRAASVSCREETIAKKTRPRV